MLCEMEFKDINYRTELFCKACGMDVGLNPIRIRHKGVVQLFCCEDCARMGKL